MDLTIRPPRSPRVRLGGYVILPRMLDKCRAQLAGAGGDYHYGCPLDQRFLTFVGVDADALKAQVAQGSGDGELLAWIHEHAQCKRSPMEIAAWSRMETRRVSGDVESRGRFHAMHQEAGPKRADIVTWFDLLDLDDHVSYGGKA